MATSDAVAEKEAIRDYFNKGFTHDEILALLEKYHDIRRLVSLNICSVEGNSAGIFFSKMSSGIFVIKVK